MNRKERKIEARRRRAKKKLRRQQRCKRKTVSGSYATKAAESVVLKAIQEKAQVPEYQFPPYDDPFDDDLYLEPIVAPVPVQAPPQPAVQENHAMPNIDVGILDELIAKAKPPKAKEPPVDTHAQEFAAEVSATIAAVSDGISRQCQEDSLHEIVGRDESVIEKVRERPLPDLIPVMGEFMATKLKNFCDQVDLDHPTIQDLMKKGFQTDSEFNSTLREIMELLSLNGTSMTKVMGLLRDSFTKAKSMKEVRVAIFKPPTRTLRTAEARRLARSKKTAKEVGLKEWLEKAKHWHDHPSSFVQFARLNDSHRETVALNEKKAAKMDDLLMTSLAGSFRKRNEIIANFLNERYCGFTKLRMIDTAIVLAKVHGAIFKEDYRSVSYPRRVFDQCPFWLEPNTVYLAKNKAPDGDQNKEHRVTVEACMIPDIFAYRPRAYPLHEFTAKMPEHVQEVVKAVEDHQDMLGKALFDQFWVIVPGVALAPEMHNYAGHWVIRRGKENNCELHPSAESAEKSLDVILTDTGTVCPALLGEKDGKCFFLTYWSVA